ncbi:hypothetical protein [Natranaerofaba carboxydovora]|uniref:hypothetical protein n=1 Tax=Natranaerofaba carboxydovora TaxID=2742683 RepID=UPI001F132FDC|nr:hypothetical protein [Natranaerofaba carboxydovora]UMZ74960.1 NHL repeat protein [Natranaerofaba carboxydovora]
MNAKNDKYVIFFCTTLIMIIIVFSFAGGSNFVMAEEEKALELKAVIGDGETGHRDGNYDWARFFFPRGLELIETENDFENEGSKELIIADTQNQRLRSAETDVETDDETDDAVSTLAGDPPGFDDYGFPTGGYVDEERQQAQFDEPRDIVADSEGRLYISDSENHVIRRLSEGKVTTFAGSGEAGFKDKMGLDAKFDNPSGMDVDADDNIFVADTMNDAIRMVTPEGEAKSLKVNFNEPYDVVVDEEFESERAGDSGFLYVSDSGNQRIWEIDIDVFHDASELDELEDTAKKARQEIEELMEEKDAKEELEEAKEGLGEGKVKVQEGLEEEAETNEADAINEIYREHFEDHGVRVLAGRGANKLSDTDYIVGGDTEGSFETARFNFPKGLTVSEAGVLLVADSSNQKVRAISREDEMVRTIYEGELQGPMDLTFDNEEKLLYVSDMWNNQVFAFKVDEKLLEEKLDHDFETFDKDEPEIIEHFQITDPYKSRTWLKRWITDKGIWQEAFEQFEFEID